MKMADMPPDLSVRTYIFLELIKALVPAFVAIGGGIWVAYKYIKDQTQGREQRTILSKEDNITRLIEAQKPFATIQLCSWRLAKS
jgi:hypothetical protein